MSDGRLGAERRAAAGSTLRNQVAVVTGAAGAIGRAVAGLFAAAGGPSCASVFIVVRVPE